MGAERGLPEFFKGYGDFDAVGRLGRVKVDVGGSARGGHGGDLVGQLVGSTQHKYVITRWKGEDEMYIDATAEW